MTSYSLFPKFMGSQPIQLLTQISVPISQDWNCHRRFADDNFTASRARWRLYFSGGRSGDSRWERDKKANPNRGSRFIDAYVRNEYDEEDEFGFRNIGTPRSRGCGGLMMKKRMKGLGFHWILEEDGLMKDLGTIMYLRILPSTQKSGGPFYLTPNPLTISHALG